MSFSHKIEPGIYKLPTSFRSAPEWVDKRLKGTGFRTSSGFSAGTVFVVRRAPHLDTAGSLGIAVVLEAPFTTSREEIRGSLMEDGTTMWWTDNEGIALLLHLLVPDDSNESWVDEATRTSWTSQGCATEVLVQLLESGKLTRTDVEEVLAMLKEKGS